MAGTTNNFDLPYQEIDDAPNGPTLGQDLAEAVDTALLGLQTDLTDGTSGTWTPVASGFSPALSGTWSGSWRRVGDLMMVIASITLTASYTITSFPDSWSVTGLPVASAGTAVAGGYMSWGNHPWPAMVDGSTIYVRTTSKTGSNINSGQIIKVTALYLAAS